MNKDRSLAVMAATMTGSFNGLHHNNMLDVDDPYPEGYVLNDTWGVTGKLTQ